jgi:hypothetical protein
MGSISDNAKEIIFEKVKEFRFSDEDLNKRKQMRKEFVGLFTPPRIKSLSPEGYFPGLGKKDDCIGYQLEWATRPLGSIKGGSMAKYGPKEQFTEIKKLLVDLTNDTDEMSNFYKPDGELSDKSKALIADSQKIRGMKSGRTVLGKLLSIYYPNTFIPFFTDQVYLLSAILKDFSEDSIGLEAYMKNNYLFLKIKEEILSEPAFVKIVSQEQLTNDFLYKFLYFCFPRAKETVEPEEETSQENERFEALETEHYQKLIHRNFKKLFEHLRYFDEEFQNAHEGHYSTEDVGIMDFLCSDRNNNFVVIELKRKSTDTTLAQLCRYMGWVKENLAEEEQKVHGLIISESKDIRLEYAIKVVPNVEIKQMTLNVMIGNF